MKRGLALEGGGAKGAYHIGVYKALLERGYEFDGFVGTSIGAINAAILAQGEFEKALDLWSNISPNQIFIEEQQPLLQLAEAKATRLNVEAFFDAKNALSNTIHNHGISTDRMMEFLHEHIDESKVRKSGKDFGLVTISLSERKPHELMLEEIPHGKLVHYIMASASFPGFSPVTIDGKKHLDGSLYNNCPVNLLDRLGYQEIIAIRVGSPPGIKYKRIDKMGNVKLIAPKENLGEVLNFTAESTKSNIKLGYHDGLRFTDKLRGNYYYIKVDNVETFNEKLMALDDQVIDQVKKALNIRGVAGRRILFEKIIPRISLYLMLSKSCDYADFVIALLEYRARQNGIDRFQVYDHIHLSSLIKQGNTDNSGKTKERVPGTLIHTMKQDLAIQILVDNLF